MMQLCESFMLGRRGPQKVCLELYFSQVTQALSALREMDRVASKTPWRRQEFLPGSGSNNRPFEPCLLLRSI